MHYSNRFVVYDTFMLPYFLLRIFAGIYSRKENSITPADPLHLFLGSAQISGKNSSVIFSPQLFPVEVFLDPYICEFASHSMFFNAIAMELVNTAALFLPEKSWKRINI